MQTADEMSSSSDDAPAGADPYAAAYGAGDPRAEAQHVIGDEWFARVLEPSPPAVNDGVWFADDPVNAGGPRPIVSPVPNADLTWDEWLRDRPDAAEWAAARWLASYQRLPSIPSTFAMTRLAVQRLVVYVISPARQRANGKIALRWTLGGIGTPFFGDDEQVRIVGRHLVRQQRGTAEVQPISSLAAAAEFVLGGAPDVARAEGFDVPPVGDVTEQLPIDDRASRFLSNWYGFATSVLETLRAEWPPDETSRVQLWAEHFDVAFNGLTGARATFGASPGDAAVEEPYLYVLPTDFDVVATRADWNAKSFRGAILPFSGFVAAPEQRDAALTFLRRYRDALADV